MGDGFVDGGFLGDGVMEMKRTGVLWMMMVYGRHCLLVPAGTI